LADFFQVDIDVLQQFIKTLQQSDDHMQTALKAMTGAGEGGKIGTDALNGAAGDFQNTWQYGLSQLGSKIKDTTEGVSKVHDAYKATEDGLSQTLNKVNGVTDQLGQVASKVANFGGHKA
jgi:hypothetical protein